VFHYITTALRAVHVASPPLCASELKIDAVVSIDLCCTCSLLFSCVHEKRAANKSDCLAHLESRPRSTLPPARPRAPLPRPLPSRPRACPLATAPTSLHETFTPTHDTSRYAVHRHSTQLAGIILLQSPERVALTGETFTPGYIPPSDK
jgi:hypothetical protein